MPLEFMASQRISREYLASTEGGASCKFSWVFVDRGGVKFVWTSQVYHPLFLLYQIRCLKNSKHRNIAIILEICMKRNFLKEGALSIGYLMEEALTMCHSSINHLPFLCLINRIPASPDSQKKA